MLSLVEQFALFSAVCDGRIDAQQEEALTELLRTDGTARLRYVRFMNIHSGLMSSGGSNDIHAVRLDSLPGYSISELIEPGIDESLKRRVDRAYNVTEEGLVGAESESPGSEVSESNTSDSQSRSSQEKDKRRTSRTSSRSKPVLLQGLSRSYGQLATLAVLLLVGVFGWMAFHPFFSQDKNQALASEAPVAEIQFVKNGRWIDPDVQLESGTKLFAGQKMNLAEGTVGVRYSNGVTVAVEGPTQFEVASETSFRLEKGKVAALARKSVEKFQIMAPGVRISNLGTSFGVSCSHDLTTELEVIEGAVEILSKSGEKTGQIVGLGESARVDVSGNIPDITKFVSNESRSTSLLESLWEDQPVRSLASQSVSGPEVIQADFEDSPVAGMVDTFHGAVSGKGWVTPWFSSGNPLGETRRDQPLVSDGGQYLTIRFYRSLDRVVAREYGSYNEFDSNRPHVISWSWRFEGDTEQFRDSFRNSAFFYGNPYFRSATWLDNTWLIGVVGANEEIGERRRVYPMRWFAFDGVKGNAYDQGNMVDTGMELEPNQVYRFVVVVYPDQSRYDFSIQSDQESFVQKGLYFRSKKAVPGNVIHFGLSAEDETCDASFSLDTIHIEPLTDEIIERGLLLGGPGAPVPSANKIHP